MASETDTTRPHTATWVKVLLALSLAMNLAVAGLVVGLALRPGGDGTRSERSMDLAGFGAPYATALPRSERRAVLRALREERGASLPDRAARRAMAQDVLAALRARPFDSKALEEAVTRQAEASVAVQRRVQAAWIGVVAQMSDSERTRYADAVEQVLSRRKNGGRD